MPKLFISKPLSEVESLRSYCEQRNWELTARSLIAFEPISFIIHRDFDVIFFTSPRSVMYFLREIGIPRNKIVACTGEGTSSLLRSLGYQPDFIGEGSDPTQIGLQFKVFLENRTVLFPIAEQSLRSISKQINSQQVEEIPVYRTIPVPAKIEPMDIYVFSSPSNYNSFKETNSVPNQAILISWGRSTQKAITEDGFQTITMKESSLNGLLSELDLIQ
jgi:uroporphyrinogen-III synthase